VTSAKALYSATIGEAQGFLDLRQMNQLGQRGGHGLPFEGILERGGMSRTRARMSGIRVWGFAELNPLVPIRCF
jgi:hypothetical protein